MTMAKKGTGHFGPKTLRTQDISVPVPKWLETHKHWLFLDYKINTEAQLVDDKNSIEISDAIRQIQSNANWITMWYKISISKYSKHIIRLWFI